MARDQYNAAVIGSGQGGNPLAFAMAAAGRKTALVEPGDVGGTCINTGCTPTKTMIASARAAYGVGRAADYGVQAALAGVELASVVRRKSEVVQSFRSSMEKHIGSTENLTLLRGTASFTGPNTLRIAMNDGSQREIAADQIFINTGARPSVPRIDGLNDVPYLDSSSVQTLEDVPEHLVILGGGYVALEFAQMFRRFGSRVTIIEHGPQLLGREDKDITDEIAKILTSDGIDIFLSSEVVSVRRAADQITLATHGPKGDRSIVGSHLLIATGRTPNSDGLRLENAGVDVDPHGYVEVNENLETTARAIWALGDVKGGPQFTHIAYDDYRILECNLLKGGSRTTADRPVPYVVFIDPQLGRVGLAEHEARAQGLSIKVATLPMSRVARAIETGETRGFMKAIVDSGTDQILGAAILGVEGGVVMSAVEIAMLGKLPYMALRDGVFAHPTLAESLNNLFMTLD